MDPDESSLLNLFAGTSWHPDDNPMTNAGLAGAAAVNRVGPGGSAAEPGGLSVGARMPPAAAVQAIPGVFHGGPLPQPDIPHLTMTPATVRTPVLSPSKSKVAEGGLSDRLSEWGDPDYQMLLASLANDGDEWLLPDEADGGEDDPEYVPNDEAEADSDDDDADETPMSTAEVQLLQHEADEPDNMPLLLSPADPPLPGMDPFLPIAPSGGPQGPPPIMPGNASMNLGLPAQHSAMLLATRVTESERMMLAGQMVRHLQLLLQSAAMLAHESKSEGAGVRKKEEVEGQYKETQRMVRDLRKYRDRSWRAMRFEPGPDGTGVYTASVFERGDELELDELGQPKKRRGRPPNLWVRDVKAAGRRLTRSAYLKIEGQSRSMLDVPGMVAAEDALRALDKYPEWKGERPSPTNPTLSGWTECLLERFWRNGGMRVESLTLEALESAPLPDFDPQPPTGVLGGDGDDGGISWGRKVGSLNSSGDGRGVDDVTNVMKFPPFTPSERRMLLRGLAVQSVEKDVKKAPRNRQQQLEKMYRKVCESYLSGRTEAAAQWYHSLKLNAAGFNAFKSLAQGLSVSRPVFTLEEDALLWHGHTELHTELGTGTYWDKIRARYLPNRTAHELRHRWETVLCKAPPPETGVLTRALAVFANGGGHSGILPNHNGGSKASPAHGQEAGGDDAGGGGHGGGGGYGDGGGGGGYGADSVDGNGGFDADFSMGGFDGGDLEFTMHSTASPVKDTSRMAPPPPQPPPQQRQTQTPPISLQQRQPPQPYSGMQLPQAPPPPATLPQQQQGTAAKPSKVGRKKKKGGVNTFAGGLARTGGGAADGDGGFGLGVIGGTTALPPPPTASLANGASQSGLPLLGESNFSFPDFNLSNDGMLSRSRHSQPAPPITRTQPPLSTRSPPPDPPPPQAVMAEKEGRGNSRSGVHADHDDFDLGGIPDFSRGASHSLDMPTSCASFPPALQPPSMSAPLASPSPVKKRRSRLSVSQDHVAPLPSPPLQPSSSPRSKADGFIRPFGGAAGVLPVHTNASRSPLHYPLPQRSRSAPAITTSRDGVTSPVRGGRKRQRTAMQQQQQSPAEGVTRSQRRRTGAVLGTATEAHGFQKEDVVSSSDEESEEGEDGGGGDVGSVGVPNMLLVDESARTGWFDKEYLESSGDEGHGGNGGRTESRLTGPFEKEELIDSEDEAPPRGGPMTRSRASREHTHTSTPTRITRSTALHSPTAAGGAGGSRSYASPQQQRRGGALFEGPLRSKNAGGRGAGRNRAAQSSSVAGGGWRSPGPKKSSSSSSSGNTRGRPAKQRDGRGGRKGGGGSVRAHASPAKRQR